MSEHALWLLFQRHLRPFGKLIRIEERFEKGVPDVLYNFQGAVGWIELKHVSAWPVKAAISIPSLKREQVAFLLDWERAGGRAWCLLQIDHAYALLRPETLADLYEGRVWLKTLQEVAEVFSPVKLPAAQILHALKKEIKL